MASSVLAPQARLSREAGHNAVMSLFGKKRLTEMVSCAG
jgi:hypothetical protein